MLLVCTEIDNNCIFFNLTPTTKNPLKRYSILDRCFSNTGPNYTFEDLKEAVNDWMLVKDPQSKGISMRQLRDDKAIMKSSDGWEVNG